MAPVLLVQSAHFPPCLSQNNNWWQEEVTVAVLLNYSVKAHPLVLTSNSLTLRQLSGGEGVNETSSAQRGLT